MTEITLVCDACGKRETHYKIDEDRCIVGWDRICATVNTEESLYNLNYPDEKRPLIDYWDLCHDCTGKILLSLRKKKKARTLTHEDLTK